MEIRDGMTVVDLVNAYEGSGAFNAGKLASACRLYERMIKEDVTIALTLAGAMTPAGLGGAVVSLIERGLIDFVVSTGANLYHDLHFALGLKVIRGEHTVDDRVLRKEGLVRIYDIYVPEKGLLETDAFITRLFSHQSESSRISSAELHYAIGKEVLERAKNPSASLVAQAAKYDLPIYTSSPGDSSIGINLAALKLAGSKMTVDPDLDVLESTAIVYCTGRNGGIIIGGGSPKNFYLQTQPTLSQILGIESLGHDYVIQITTDQPHYGGLSGATPWEAVSWGKVDPATAKSCVVVYSDATVAAPILFAYVVAKGLKREPKRLYSRRDEFMGKLRIAAGRKV